MRRLVEALVVVAVTSFGCSREATRPAPVTAQSSASTTSGGCAPWRGRGFVVTARTQGGRGDFFRELTYDDAAGVVRVHDSDPFATGSEQKEPRVIERSVTLTAEQHNQIAFDLLKICPTTVQMEDRCAPGGCASMHVVSPAGEATVENSEIVTAVMKRLRVFFPELRTKE